MPCVVVNKIGIFYEERGEGFPLIFLSGLTQETRAWKGQAAFFSKRFRVVTYDPRGQGMSDKPDRPDAYSLSDHLDDLTGLMDHLGIDRADLVGLSQGGMVAQWAALHAPERVAGLVLVDTGASTTLFLRSIFQGWIGAAESGGGELFFNVSFPWIFSERFVEANPLLINTLRDLSKDLPARAIAHLLRAALSLDLKDQIHRIQAPTLILCGERDLLTPPSYARLLHEKIIGSRLILFPECGHVPPAECPEEFNRAVWEFLIDLEP